MTNTAPTAIATELAESIARLIQVEGLQVEDAAAKAGTALATQLVVDLGWNTADARQAALGLTADVLAAVYVVRAA